MWGLTWRSALALLFIPSLAAAGGYLLDELLTHVTDGIDTPKDPFYTSLVWVSEPTNLILVGLVAVVLAFVAGSLVEGGRGA
jgi:hypothetical protein